MLVTASFSVSLSCPAAISSCARVNTSWCVQVWGDRGRGGGGEEGEGGRRRKEKGGNACTVTDTKYEMVDSGNVVD